MQLVVPYIVSPDALDQRLMRLAEFAGARCSTLGLPPGTPSPRALSAAAGDGDVLALNARTFNTWLGERTPAGLGEELRGSSPRILLYGVWPGAFCDALVSELTGNQIEAVGSAEPAAQYSVPPDALGPSAPFAGRTLQPPRPIPDHVFRVHPAATSVQRLILLGGEPVLVVSRHDAGEVFCLGSGALADLEEIAGARAPGELFGLLVPALTALRCIFGDRCWRPTGPPRASLTIDDPLLRPRYGYLDYARLAEWLEPHNFAVTIAFIPHNYRRSAGQTASLFRQNAHRLGICFHGNDHTRNELASRDPARINTVLRLAEARMAEHEAATGIPCPKVVVFPQEHFSLAAVQALQARNYWAAVKEGASPVGQRRELTLAETIEPAFIGHAGFPLFQRQRPTAAAAEEVPFDVFFGRPVLLWDHHEFFRRPENLLANVARVNAMAPGLRWGGLDEAVLSATLTRTGDDGSVHVRAYSTTVRVTNSPGEARSHVVEWNLQPGGAPVEGALCAGASEYSVEIGERTVKLRVPLAPGEACTCSVLYRNELAATTSPRVWPQAKAALRRRLSEARDNYASKSPLGVAATEAMRRRLAGRRANRPQ